METVFPADDGDVRSQSSEGGIRFRVEEVAESPTKSPPARIGSVSSNDGSGLSVGAAATRTVGTIGYSTAEPVPMTLYYRNQGSNSGAKARPTLHELHHDTADNEVDVTTRLLDGPLPASGPGSPSDAEANALPTVVKFGWIKGVLVRCLLNIWGVMLFLRLSWVVGQAGIGHTFLIILLASVVTTITTLSMSAICTNGEVKGGGAYYLISRSLGPEFGGAIGIVFSVANAVAVSLYVVGFAETVRDLLKDGGNTLTTDTWDVVIVGLITVTLLLGIALIGMDWEARAQIVLLALLLIAVVNFFVGSFIGPKSQAERLKGFSPYSSELHAENFSPGYEGESFFTVFAVFFPAATGILAGANISGDLKNPQTAIPKGTLSAIGLSSVLYVVMAWVVGACVARDATGPMTNVSNFTDAVALCSNVSYDCQFGLLNTFQNMELVSGFRWLITIGIFSATLSSALASLVGAPKIFQAVCKDRIFPFIHIFAKGGGRTGTEPHRGYILTYVIACGFILIGDLNAIAPIISNFFLLSYALINFSCFNASFANSPGWRPAFKYYNQYLALLGGLLCLAIMFIIKWWTALITLAVVSLLYKYIDYKKPPVNWGSSGQALTYSNALRFASKMEATIQHVKNYRPQVLVMTGLPADRPNLAWFAHCLTKDVAMMMCGNILLGDEVFELNKQVQREKNNQWLASNKIKAFHRVVVYPDLRNGALSLMQSAGLGKLSPNILMMGYKSDWLSCVGKPALDQYVNVIHDAFDLSYAVAILRLPGESFYKERVEVPGASDETDAVGRRYALASEASSTENIPKAVSYRRNPSEVHFYSGTPAASATPVAGATSSNQTVTSGEVGSAGNGGGNAQAEVNQAQTAYFVARRLQAKHADVDSTSCFSRGMKMTGTIDVWWLHDDGGLTILLPHLLTLSSQFRGCKLRVFTHGSSQKITSERLRMTTLLNKFRIEVKSVEIVTDLNKHPSAESQELTDHLPGWNEVRQDNNSRQKLLRQVRIGECIRATSKDASLVVASLPIARKKDCSPTMYMSWLEALSVQQTVPLLLVRGNQSDVITFYS